MGTHEVRWRPNVTVAAYIEQDGRLLMVREHTSRDGIRINNAAGHLEAEETPLEAVCREVLEETGHRFEPQAILGFYLSDIRRQGGEVVRFLRIAFVGSVGPREVEQLDEPIIETLWLTPQELRARAAELRSPLILRGLDDYEAGRRFPLDLIWSAE
ncbi:8-oxo-dGTP pyrophosphatase MutT (NUDIX family) [Inhella inkyongensis]|uniref:8-oxo-dGTP pyrophosphatase MutT (NUDIX family) n=1 Tax=Inhella inkyongensis TaxID=392593 RepID=A0A840S1K0_9BURK|nr:NUDIX domain-containing protein [Inhella inkyongensis]MBB5202956.1 8-oxo-dGTP pyrophosphatase MutT (NUDIX family) [Inhella inkyongensis]